MQIEPLPRRKFLKLATASMATIGTATAFMYGCADAPEIKHTEFGRFLVLNDDTARTLLAMIQVTLPKAALSNEELHQQVLFRTDEELSFVNGKIQEDSNLALNVLEYLPLVYGQFSRFSRLSVAERNTLLAKLQHTKSDTVRAVVNSCRQLPLYIYYGMDSSWKDIGYDGSFSKLDPIVSEQRRYYGQKVGRKVV